MTKVRCAIYTRKSSEEGLEQDFNSLDAQREACTAYILSQASEGWSLLDRRYDDGGLSGGTLERPALQQLLRDIEAGLLDIVVVYKVDRLTRSLLDFSKLVETMDEAEVSFVSVTQSFNTTTSMGRLTLNMLLSFAQFEREVTAERIRDKIAASKAKGMWMGGTPPLGYEPDGRTLKVVPEHAEVIRLLFALYDELGTVPKVQDRLDEEGVVVPIRTIGKGRQIGGKPFLRAQVYRLLSNPVYIGKIAHRGTVHDGQHDAIIEQGLWDRVQAKLKANAQGEQRAKTVKSASLLAGRCFDGDGEPLVASHAVKDTRRYRYYVSRSLQHGKASGRSGGMRIPATELEKAVAQQIADWLGDPLAVLDGLGSDLTPDKSRAAIASLKTLAARICKRERFVMRQLCTRVTIHAEKLAIEISPKQLTTALDLPAAPDLDPIVIDSQATLQRSGRKLTFVQDGKRASSSEPSAELVRLLAKARSWWNRIAEGGIEIAALAREEDINPSYVSRVVRLNFLAPALVEDILQGKQPASVSAQSLRLADLPVDWETQRKAFAG